MSESGGAPTGAGGTEVVVQRHRVSIIWLIPLVAALIGGWLAYQSYREQGPTITITFSTADGLEAGKTKIRYRAVEVGTVSAIHVSDDRQHVVVTAEMIPQTTTNLLDDARFWVVKPRVSASGITGLGTIISGYYIGMRLGTSGSARRDFEGLEAPPIGKGDSPGLHLRVRTDALRSLGPESPVYYRDIQVGIVQNHELDPDGGHITLHVFIDEPYKKLVREKTRFYDAGGIHASVGLGGVEVEVASLDALVIGGIAFETPPGDSAGGSVQDGALFDLYGSHESVVRQRATEGLHLVLESSQAGSVQVGDHVYYRELAVGSVLAVELSLDSRRVRTELSIQPGYASLVRSNTKFWNASGISADLGLSGLHVHAESLESLLTGGLAFATPAPPGHPVTAGSVFELHAKSKEEWHDWSPGLWRGDPAKAPKGKDAEPQASQGDGARFHHHEGKSERDTREEHAAHAEHRSRGFFGRLFGGD